MYGDLNVPYTVTCLPYRTTYLWLWRWKRQVQALPRHEGRELAVRHHSRFHRMLIEG